jgi:MoaA/NifB/PqqE/SkfB family radical SAM enzyme
LRDRAPFLFLGPPRLEEVSRNARLPDRSAWASRRREAGHLRVTGTGHRGDQVWRPQAQPQSPRLGIKGVRLPFRKEQLFRYRKYLEVNLPHLTLAKLANAAKVEWRLRTRRADMRGAYPYNLIVDLSNTCNLRCPLCFAGQRRLVPRKNLMSLKSYKRVIEPLRDYLLQVFLYNNSEPLLNRDVYDIISHNRSSNIGSVVSTNLSLPVDAERLVSSGLEYLIVSIDGSTQETYERYRVGGDLDLVLANLKDVLEARSRARSRLPFIEWQTLVTSKNEAELNDLKRFAYDLGVDVVRFANLNFYAVEGDTAEIEAEWLPEDPAYRAFASERTSLGPGARRRPCFWLWRTSVICANGGVIPCCLFDTSDWGNVLEQSFADIWNGRLYRSARRLGVSSVQEPSGTVCDGCPARFVWRGEG